MKDQEKAALAGAGAAAAAAVGKISWDRASARRAAAEAERAFALQRGEPVPSGIRRIVRAQIQEASEQLRSGKDRGKAVHGARKNFKRVRSTLRLVSGPLGKEQRGRESAVIRGVAQQLSGARDSQVMLETLDRLTEAQELGAGSFREHLEARHRTAQQELKAEREKLDEVARVLQEAEVRVASWKFSGSGKAKQLAPGLAQVYRRGREDYRRAQREPTAEHLHEWRKRAKDLWYSAQIMQPLAPKRMAKLAKRAHHLADLLGDDHDLAVLREEVVAHADPAERQALLEPIDRRSAELRREAFAAGKQLYRRKGADFERRLTR